MEQHKKERKHNTRRKERRLQRRKKASVHSTTLAKDTALPDYQGSGDTVVLTPQVWNSTGIGFKNRQSQSPIFAGLDCHN